MLSPGRDGVLGTLKQCTSPSGVTNTRSVNVPPTSVPIEQCKIDTSFRTLTLRGLHRMPGLSIHCFGDCFGDCPVARHLHARASGYTGHTDDLRQACPRRPQNAKITRETMRYRPTLGN